ncbi:rhamnulokinase [Candidatus Planktophila dulcis]|uniref:rhamnulokinase n=1 Tax=Candidatus Planktophila dulcis TaxID=1884914 RepID=UPI000BACD136|nr:rhamnulokinase family protein [Candidatus Planktophila dulcis]ASY21877.1 rhamnulokinase [Candidatus Planktophila dulcis]
MFEFLAVDLGATSGRVAIGRVGSDSISLDVVHRFLHEVLPQEDGSLLWDWDLILTEVLTGLKEAIKTSDPISLAVDSWAVDYGFISPTHQYLPPVHAYRDPRNEIAYQELSKKIGKERIYSTTGIQFLPFNTIYQLYAARNLPEYTKAAKFLMLPDLVNFLFTQKLSTEVTNASSTQALNTRTREWDRELIKLAGIRDDLFTDLHEPGTLIGVVHGFDELDGINVVATASHDTAAAIAGVPFGNRLTEAYISSGTWSLVGVELDAPVLTPEAFAANVTNELGADGTVRALKNVTGMWILEECRRTWHLEGRDYEMPELLTLASAAKSFTTLIDPNDPLFAPPGGMPQRIRAYCVERGLTPPQTDGEYAICILNSLAHAYKKTLAEISAVTGRTIEVIHILGGGSQNDLLNQLTADICGMTVKTGPVEATLFGNIAVQAISAGVVANLTQARALIAKSFTSKVFQPA